MLLKETYEDIMSTFSIVIASILWTCLALILFCYAIYPLLDLVSLTMVRAVGGTNGR